MKINIKELLVASAISLSLITLLYLTTAFIMWNLNPATWQYPTRLLVGISGVMCVILAFNFVLYQ